MKKLASVAIVCLVLTSLLPNVALSQEISPQWFVVFEETVSPYNRQEFMKVQKEAVELWKKYEMDIPVMAYQNDDNALYWVIPIENFASIDTMYDKMSEIGKKMEKDGYNGNEKFRDLSTISQTIMTWNPELSYHPNDEFGQTFDERYVEWMFCYLRSGHEQEAADAVKDYIKYYSENNLDYSWDVFNVLFGNDLPLMIMMVKSENPEKLKALESGLMQENQEAFDKMWSNFATHVRRIENKTGWFSPNLSHFTEE